MNALPLVVAAFLAAAASVTAGLGSGPEAFDRAYGPPLDVGRSLTGLPYRHYRKGNLDAAVEFREGVAVTITFTKIKELRDGGTFILMDEFSDGEVRKLLLTAVPGSSGWTPKRVTHRETRWSDEKRLAYVAQEIGMLYVVRLPFPEELSRPSEAEEPAGSRLPANDPLRKDTEGDAAAGRPPWREEQWRRAAK
jgi:hypothetical protein